MIDEQPFSKASGPTPKFKHCMSFIEATMGYQIRKRRILIESLPVLPGSESIVEFPGLLVGQDRHYRVKWRSTILR